MLSEGLLQVGCAPLVLGLAQHPDRLTGVWSIKPEIWEWGYMVGFTGLA